MLPKFIAGQQWMMRNYRLPVTVLKDRMHHQKVPTRHPRVKEDLLVHQANLVRLVKQTDDDLYLLVNRKDEVLPDTRYGANEGHFYYTRRLTDAVDQLAMVKHPMSWNIVKGRVIENGKYASSASVVEYMDVPHKWRKLVLKLREKGYVLGSKLPPDAFEYIEALVVDDYIPRGLMIGKCRLKMPTAGQMKIHKSYRAAIADVLAGNDKVVIDLR